MLRAGRTFFSIFFILYVIRRDIYIFYVYPVCNIQEGHKNDFFSELFNLCTYNLLFLYIPYSSGHRSSGSSKSSYLFIG